MWFRDHETGKGVAKAKEVIRRHVEFLDIDRPLYNDHIKRKELVKSCEILEAVEKEFGSLEYVSLPRRREAAVKLVYLIIHNYRKCFSHGNYIRTQFPLCLKQFFLKAL